MTIGADAHKRTHTFVAVDEVGRKLDEKTVTATSDGHLQAVARAGQWVARTWALEDCRNLTRRLEGDLLAGGEAVLRVFDEVFKKSWRRRHLPFRRQVAKAFAERWVLGPARVSGLRRV